MSVSENWNHKNASTLTKSIGLPVATALVIGNMVGSGVFLLPASLAPYGGWSLGGWAITSLGAILLALIFSRLSKRLPKAGGPYAYARAGFGNFGGFFIAWGYWISMITANAAIAVAFASYMSVFFPVLDTSPIAGAAVALLGVWVITMVNIWGIQAAGSIQIVTTLLKLLPLLAVGIAGLWYFDLHSITAVTPTSSATGASAINATAALTLWAFLGLESATIPAQHVKDAKRTIPRATLLGTCIVAIVYILSTTMVMGIVPNATLAQSAAPFAEAAKAMWGGWAGYFIAAGGAIACFGTLNGWIMMQGQLPEAVANDGLFPRLLANRSRWDTPAASLIISSIIVSFLVAMNYSRGLVQLFTFSIRVSTLSTLIPYLFSVLAEWMLCRSAHRTKTLGLWDSTLAFLAFVYTIWAIIGIGQQAVYWGFLLLLLGLPLYVWLRHPTRLSQDQPDKGE